MSQLGFTLFELCIVLVILGLMVGAVMGGYNLVRQARIGTIVEEAESIKKGISDFIKTYNALPGDMSDATDKLGSTLGSYSILNGDGNGTISTAEGLKAIQHLAAGGFVNGIYDGSTSAPKTGLMASAADPKVIYQIINSSNIIYVRVSKYQSGTGYGFITPQDAMAIDVRYDDGYPDTGFIRGVTATSGAVSTCFTASAYTATSTYNDCMLDFLLSPASVTVVSAPAAVSNCLSAGSSYAVGATINNRYNCSNFGLTAQAITEICRTGGYWEVQAGQTCH